MNKAGQSRLRRAASSAGGACSKAPLSSNKVSASRTGPRTAPTPRSAISAACKAFNRRLSAAMVSQTRPLKKSHRLLQVDTWVVRWMKAS